MFHKSRILIVEDQAMIAIDLARTVEELDGVVIGPAASVADALAIIAGGVSLYGSLLDNNLGDGDVTPVALRLLKGAVPIVIHSGVGVPSDLGLAHHDLPLVMKPGVSQAVLTLDKLIREKRAASQS
jgi:hypothetical protein